MSETVTAVAADRSIVSLGELQRAWQAVQSGRFRSTTRTETTAYLRDDAALMRGSAGEWYPSEAVVPVLGAGGGVGTTILALALASASTAPARVVECCSAAASGLAAASTAELGATDSGWRRGLREGQHHRILLERAASPITAADAVPLPTDPDRLVMVTFLDCGWDLDHLLAHGWIAQQVERAPAVVVAASATIPGLRRLEITLESVGVEHVVAGVLGPRRKRWGRRVEGSLGPAARHLDDVGAMVEIPLDRALGVYGLSATPLPQAVLAAASQLLNHLPPPANPPRDNHGHGQSADLSADLSSDLGAVLGVAVRDR